MRIARNVVECLWVVNAKVGASKYQFRVKAESEATAKEKAQRMATEKFNSTPQMKILSVEKIEPDDFVE